MAASAIQLEVLLPSLPPTLLTPHQLAQAFSKPLLSPSMVHTFCLFLRQVTPRSWETTIIFVPTLLTVVAVMYISGCYHGYRTLLGPLVLRGFAMIPWPPLIMIVLQLFRGATALSRNIRPRLDYFWSTVLRSIFLNWNSSQNSILFWSEQQV